MSLPWAARGLKIPYVVRNDWQYCRQATVAALTRRKELGKLPT
ncbi:hypothetical protein [Streptomyces sp. NPDC046862]